jgi:hypothetical protein
MKGIPGARVIAAKDITALENVVRETLIKEI